MIKKINTKIKKSWWIVFLLGLVIWIVYIWRNCNLWEEKNCTGFIGKTIWDVLELIIIPVTLAGVAVILDRLERKADRENSRDNQQEVALQNYFDAMSRLILDKDLRNSSKNEVRKIAQVKTISTLERLNLDRKSKLINFLWSLDLVYGSAEISPIISLSGIDLRHVQLIGSNLEGANLGCANLEGANLDGSNLECAYLGEAHLENTHLEGAYLDKADLTLSHLKGAYLYKAHLYGAHLEGADLEGADLEDAHLEGAHLEGANLVVANFFGAHLEGIKLEGAIMPDGYKYDESIHNVELLIHQRPR